MSALIITALVVLVFIVIYQITRASEMATILKDEEKVSASTNKLMSWMWVGFFILGLIGIYKCHHYLMPMMLPESASVEGAKYDQMLLITLYITGFVFFATQALLFYFSFKYRSKEGRKAYFYAHNNKLEVIWTTIPALVLLVLVVFGLRNWIAITSPAPENSLVVEVVGKQFNFIVRYPGPDGVFGTKNFRLINDANNPLGLDWNDPASKDDIIIETGELHIIKDRPVKLVLGSRDVIHNVGLNHFRVKMDCVPGITTTLWFTPSITTEEMKSILQKPDFVYEIACSEMCGKGHYSMKGTVVVQTQDEFDTWIKEQKSYYSIAFGTEEKEAAPATTDTVTTSENAVAIR
jgi:cytochrome c oxidase subunit 2